MVHEERLQAIADTWTMLRPGDLWCVIETPNRLWHTDTHTALLPFYHWLPDDLAFKYARFSQRTNFREMRKQGLRPFAVGAIGEVAIAIFTLALVVGAEKLIGF